MDRGEKSTTIMVNPVITEKTGEVRVKEGCLSFPGVGVDVKRSSDLCVTYQNTKGETKVLKRRMRLRAKSRFVFDGSSM